MSVKYSTISVIKTQTVGGYLCKQYVTIALNTKTPRDSAIVIQKYILSDKLIKGFACVKKVKGKKLLKQWFSIKLDTLGYLTKNIDSFLSSLSHD